jgi:DNA polymerase V
MDMTIPQGLEVLGFEPGSHLALPLLLCPAPAGFPSPADDYIDQHLNLNEYLVSHPASTFFVRASGQSMDGDHIQPGDILVVDRAVEPTNGRIVIATVNGELTVKRLRRKNGRVYLEPANPAFKPVEILPGTDFEVWGVVTFIVHKA